LARCGLDAKVAADHFHPLSQPGFGAVAQVGGTGQSARLFIHGAVGSGDEP